MSATLACQRVVAFGGASGVGLAAAKLLASKGAEVVVAGRGTDRVATALAAELGGRATAREVDGRDVAAVRAFFEEVGPFDHLVVTAGATNRGAASSTRSRTRASARRSTASSGCR